MPLDGRLAAEFPPLAAADTKNISGLDSSYYPEYLRCYALCWRLLSVTVNDVQTNHYPAPPRRPRISPGMALQRVLPGEIPVLSDAQINTFE